MKKLISHSPIILAVYLCMAGGLSSCKKYLDARPDQTQVVPSTLADLEALLNNVQVMNRFYPSYGEAASDDYYVTQKDYAALVTAQDKTLYTWDPNGAVVDGQWLSPYKVVLYANQVLETLGQGTGGSPDQRVQVKGAALFFRAYSFFQLACLFSPPYDPQTAGTGTGIPLRLSPDFNVRSVRATEQQTYGQILSDFSAAARLLPETTALPALPTRMAAYGAIARTYLAMGAYIQAGRYADSCLELHPPLMDFNMLNAGSSNPISRFNAETIFYAMSNGSTLLVPSRCKVDSNLHALYAANDLRRTIFFKNNNNGSYAFKGNYDGVQGSTIFSGVATDEIYLIAAECHARAGETDLAMQDLNTLLKTRFAAGTFIPLTAADAGTALTTILTERRKELVFRGTRWTDLRRLNRETAYQVTLKRVLGPNSFTLPPQDPRYTFLIPQDVIAETGIPQNPR